MTSIIALCLIVTVLLVSPLLASDCESGWVRGLHQLSSCYKFVNEPIQTWSGAVQTCRNLGGHLATFETTDEVIWIRGFRSYYAEDLAVTSAWIGGFQFNGAGQWLWHGETTHSPIFVSDWALNQPDNARSEQHCLCLFGTRSDGVSSYRWDDGTCTTRNPFICEKML